MRWDARDDRVHRPKARCCYSKTSSKNLRRWRLPASPNESPMQELLRRNRDEILRLAAVHGARNIRVFGSVARGEADEESDVDFLVDLEPGRSLLDLGGLLMDMQDLLGRRVDVVTEKGLRPRIRDRVFREAVPL